MRRSLPKTLLRKGKHSFLPLFALFSCSKFYFPIPSFLLSLLSIYFFLYFALKAGGRESETGQEAEEFRGLVHSLKHSFFKPASLAESGFAPEVTHPIGEKTSTKGASAFVFSTTCLPEMANPHPVADGLWIRLGEDFPGRMRMLPCSEPLCREWDLGQTQTDLFHERFRISVNPTAS